MDQVKDRDGLRYYRYPLVRDYQAAFDWREVLRGYWADDETGAIKSLANALQEQQAAEY